MKKLIVLLSLSILMSCAHTQNNSSDMEKQKKIYKSWVLSRCVGTVASGEQEKQDALNSASSYLEQSRFSIDAFTDAKPLITEFLARNYQGSISGSFNTMKCIDLFYSAELDKLFSEKYELLKK